MDKVCPKCGHTWRENTRFCKNCGTNLTDVVETVADTQISIDETSKNKTSVDAQEDMVKETGPFTTERKESVNISSLTKKHAGNKKALVAIIIAAIALVAFLVSGIANNQYVTYTAGPFEYSFFDDVKIIPQTVQSNYDYEAGCLHEESGSYVTVYATRAGNASANILTEGLAKFSDKVIEEPHEDNLFETDNSKFIEKNNESGNYSGYHIFRSADHTFYILKVDSDDLSVVNDVLNSLKFNSMSFKAGLTPLKKQ